MIMFFPRVGLCAAMLLPRAVRRAALCVTLVGGLLLTPVLAWGRSYEIAQHRDWASWIESSGREQIWAATATITRSRSQRILLSMDFMPGACGIGVASMTIPMFGYADAPFSAAGAIRVDRRGVIESRFSVEPHPEGIRITMDEAANDKLLRDAREGSIVRIKIETEGEREPLYLRFSLSGFTAATNRAVGMCQRIEQVLRDEDDSTFFNDPESQAPSPTPAPKAPQTPAPKSEQKNAPTPDEALTL